MKLLLSFFALLATCWPGPGQPPRRPLESGAGRAVPPGGPCQIFYNLQSWPAFVALRFTHHGRPIEVRAPFLDTLVSDYPVGSNERLRPPVQFRFGQLHFAVAFWGNKGVNAEQGKALARCVYAGDTMHLRIYTDFVHDTFLDGIRFRKGYYELVTDYSRLPELLYYNSNPGGRGPRRPPTYFRAYFEQHQAELARENPFVACSFMFDMSHPEEWPVSDHDGYTPAKPADIPRLVLCHTPFYKMRLISMKAVPDWSQTLPQEQE